jgi:hypothetical protein
MSKETNKTNTEQDKAKCHLVTIQFGVIMRTVMRREEIYICIHKLILSTFNIHIK